MLQACDFAESLLFIHAVERIEFILKEALLAFKNYYLEPKVRLVFKIFLKSLFN